MGRARDARPAPDPRALRAERPLAGLRVGACLHVTTETANLMRTLKAGGAEVYLAASNPLSTQDSTAAALVAEYGIATYARRGEDKDTYFAHLRAVADVHPVITMDDGCDLVTLLHQERRDQLPEILAGTEETTTGVIRLKAMAADGALTFPVVAVNEALTKHLFDNRYGTGQSTIDGILRATNILIAGRNVVIAGYGWVGRGIASRMDVTAPTSRSSRWTRPGPRGADGRIRGDDRRAGRALGRPVRDRHRQRQRLPSRALRGNEGRRDHGQLRPLRRRAGPAGTARDGRGHVRDVRENVQEFDIGGKRLNLIAEGRLVNLGAAEGHPAAVMDMSFANQALCAEYVAQHHAELAAQVYVVPEAIDAEVARLKLAAMGITLDPMTPSSWSTSPPGSTGPETLSGEPHDGGAVAREVVAAPFGSWHRRSAWSWSPAGPYPSASRGSTATTSTGSRAGRPRPVAARCCAGRSTGRSTS